MNQVLHCVSLAALFSVLQFITPPVAATGQERERWRYSAEFLLPFWQADVVHDESVLFIRDPQSGLARASLLFPADEIITMRSAAGDITYQSEDDFQFRRGTREIIVPSNSRIVTKATQDLRRPPNSQKYALTHRDGNGEIFFGAKLEYHEMQTWVTYRKAANDWPVKMPTLDAAVLPRTVGRLRTQQPISIVLLGDSISTGCNASGWGGGAPYQPPYPVLLQRHLQVYYETQVELANLSVSGTSTPWGLSMIDKVVQHEPDLVILAFGMNDAAGRSADEYGRNTTAMITKIRQALPSAEFILVASMLGNRDWMRLNHDVFPLFRDELIRRGESGVAIADLTSVWQEFLKRKQDWDLTGNGVNHPNDFGHRVYAQVLSTLLIDPEFQAP